MHWQLSRHYEHKIVPWSLEWEWMRADTTNKHIDIVVFIATACHRTILFIERDLRNMEQDVVADM